jgi:histidyl-tRNA synthetase
VLNAPKINDFLASESRKSFDELLSLLKSFGISYEVDPVLVRGLDYYTNVVFEFESHSKTLGTKSTIIGGGCYDNLIQNSGQDIVGVGFGLGVERLFEILKDNSTITDDKVDVYFMINNEKEFEVMFPMICELRNQNIVVDFNKKFTKQKKVFAEATLFESAQIVYYELFSNPDNKLITIKNTIKNAKIEVEQQQVVKNILEGIANEKNK